MTLWVSKTKCNWHSCCSGTPDLYAAQRGQHLSAVLKIPLRQRLSLPSNQRGGSPDEAQCHTTLLGPLLSRLVLRSVRRTAASGARRHDIHARQARQRAAAAAAAKSTCIPTTAADPRQPGVPFPRRSEHPPPTASSSTGASTTELSGKGGRFRIWRYAVQGVEEVTFVC